ncbi:ParA family protein [Natronospirillum operosum]|uniref:ParA family protein n=1 Tax=Natronospirillum operosum TaxID=2759953 RepID=A0A4Z0W8L2_9GAMM|nr:ParA family protein [Natronospirillum operosum]TGG93299.1 ParA family protein [Natronospirillum operosum]
MAEQCPVIAITNRKGGSGKTTTAVNLAAELAARGWQILLVDADSQGHCALGLGVAPPTGHPGLHQLFRDAQISLASLQVPTLQPGLTLIPANTRFDGRVTGIEDDLLARALCELSGYDLIIVDTPPSVDPVLLNALRAADSVLIPVVPQVLGSAGVRQLAQLLYQVATQGRTDLKLLGLLPIMCDRSIPSHARVLSELGLTFGAQRIFRGIRPDVRLAEAFGAGQPVRELAPRSRGAMDYFMLVEELTALAEFPHPLSTTLQGDR